MTPLPRMYTTLARWWPLLSPPEEYEPEAARYAEVVEQHAARPVETMLELGSGGGNNASHLKRRYRMTLVDLSPDMLAVSRALNPECEHVEGDMRAVRLGRAFDAVLIHDAIAYMTTEDDLAGAIRTAAAHLLPGGVAVFVPDYTAEIYRPMTEAGGEDGEGMAMRYLQWEHPAEGGTYRTTFVFALRVGGEPLRIEVDEHVAGLFTRATWLRLIDEAGLEAGAERYAPGGIDVGREVFFGRAPTTGVPTEERPVHGRR